MVNSLRALRMAKGFSQGQLADGVPDHPPSRLRHRGGSISSDYGGGARLASVLGCHVEDLFSLKTTGELIEGD